MTVKYFRFIHWKDHQYEVTAQVSHPVLSEVKPNSSTDLFDTDNFLNNNHHHNIIINNSSKHINSNLLTKAWI